MGIKKTRNNGANRITSKVNIFPNRISAKEIQSKYHITYQTLNHYTDFGLLPVSAKVANVRFYDRKIIEKRLKHIRSLTEEGYSLRLIRKKLIGI
ncbi:MAG: helix-turn-helix domain-containing protein [Candidatus Omnitrophica bacterium]|nr:helix-turn-helix domain-containing protein [Candidatus Omnitrophota bacterium]